ncbi:hypothetical protein GCM10025780_29140 [Frondihabitans cladoniiphilus]|uniref:TadE-like protein n=1 Tax=Frondihabitans cladoniiphilus TaxID=715785 RepID=A0ABP8W8B2_9MICO
MRPVVSEGRNEKITVETASTGAGAGTEAGVALVLALVLVLALWLEVTVAAIRVGPAGSAGLRVCGFGAEGRPPGVKV